MMAIEVKDLSKHFNRKKALADVNFRIEPGEMVALIGASGSGKSTLIRHIAGLERSDAGGSVIKVFGRPLQLEGRLTGNTRELRREIGAIFQQFNLVSRLPVISNVLVGTLGQIPDWRGTLGIFTAAEKKAAVAALARVGMPDVAWQRASTLSGGQQQRAAIARCLMQRSRVILADEPIASLDPASARRVMDVLSDINRRDGITAVVSLHQVEYARRYCQRAIALRNGSVVFDGSSSALTNDFLTELYGADSEELVLPDMSLAEGLQRDPSTTPRMRIPNPATA